MLAAYDAIADWYDRFVREGRFVSSDDVVEASGLDADKGFVGCKICDLACGQGDLARNLASRGGIVVGVDISERLLDLARKEEEINPVGISYFHADVQALPALPQALFDFVFCNLALMDIENMEACLDGVCRVLRHGGSFVASITHPCFQFPKGRDYLDEGFWRSENPHGVRGQVGAYHRSLATYLTAFGNAGLLIDRVVELRPPGYDLPAALVIRCVRHL